MSSCVSGVIWKYWISLWKKERNKFLTSWGHLSQNKKRYRIALGEDSLGRPKGVYSLFMYPLLVCPPFFLPHFHWKYQSTLNYFPLGKNVVHSGTSGTCACSIFPSQLYLYPPINSCTLICFQWPSHLFSPIHPYHVHFARKAKGRDLHQREVGYISFRVIRLYKISSHCDLSVYWQLWSI